jgi:hypothetical protein
VSNLTADQIAMRDAYLELVAKDDERVAALTPRQPAAIEDMLTVAYAVTRHPLMGGEYYRATRPAALAARDFGWHTAVVEKIGSVQGSKKVAGQAYGSADHVIEPDVWIFRPMGQQGKDDNWGLEEIVEKCHDAGQFVIADLDDDIWAHEDWSEDTRPSGENDDKFETWCWKVDAWLASTPWMKARIEEVGKRRGFTPRVLVAPNCFDPIGLGHASHPIPGRRLGTRMWLSGRMSGDLEIYRECFTPLLEALDLSFVHIGKEDRTHLTDGPGQHYRSFIDDAGMPAHRVLELPSTTIPELGAIMGSTMNIACIAMADHPFNYAKTETHAVEVASAGLPIVAATSLEIYKDVPGRVDPTPEAVRERVEALLDPEKWRYWSDKSRVWARKTSVRCEATYMRALQEVVHSLVK